jgi:hypothetical protein
MIEYSFGELLKKILDGEPEELDEQKNINEVLKLRKKYLRGCHSEEHRKKISEAMKGKKNHLGKQHSEESKRKMRSSHKKHWIIDNDKRKWIN